MKLHWGGPVAHVHDVGHLDVAVRDPARVHAAQRLRGRRAAGARFRVHARWADRGPADKDPADKDPTDTDLEGVGYDAHGHARGGAALPVLPRDRREIVRPEVKNLRRARLQPPAARDTWQAARDASRTRDGRRAPLRSRARGRRSRWQSTVHSSRTLRVSRVSPPAPPVGAAPPPPSCPQSRSASSLPRRAARRRRSEVLDLRSGFVIRQVSILEKRQGSIFETRLKD